MLHFSRFVLLRSPLQVPMIRVRRFSRGKTQGVLHELTRSLLHTVVYTLRQTVPTSDL